jgi:prepilin-type N-terminal cleavage/methylation domain-containing protein
LRLFAAAAGEGRKSLCRSDDAWRIPASADIRQTGERAYASERNAGSSRDIRRAASARRHAGFTLVEVIVVLVILAILAAIAIPALTGYIDKARDREWAMRARDFALACRTVLDERYAQGYYDSAESQAYIKNGYSSSWSIKVWPLDSTYFPGNPPGHSIEAAALLGQTYIGSGSPGGWGYNIDGPKNDSTTLLNADAFDYVYFPEGSGKSSCTIVTYKLKRVSPEPTSHEDFLYKIRWTDSYDSTAGYEVYHIK